LTADPYDAVNSAIERATPAIERICAEVWELAELSLEEVASANVHLRELEAAGFAIISRGTSDQATAFIAEWQQGAGGPRVGFLPEYDALPGLGNAAAPEQAPALNGKTNGHGCGHNLLGAGCTGAAIALKAIMEQEGLPGLVRVYGCAAEETTGAKVFMARDGLFDDLDACLAWHSAPVAAVGLVRTAAVNNVRVEFFGRSAHAGVDPWQGRSALDALELYCHGLNLMREHVEPTARIHYVIEAGGETPNVVPDYTRLAMFIRDVDRAHVEATTQWARELADGAATGTQTRAKFTLAFGMYDLLPNTPLVEQLDTHLQAVGVPAWTEDEQAFARECQRNFGVPEVGLVPQPLPLLPDQTAGGSTDVGDVSWNTPTVAFLYPSFPLGIGLHTWPVTACGGMSIGTRAAIGAATVLARLGQDLMTDAELRDAARADFDARRAGRAYVSPLVGVDVTSSGTEEASHQPKDGADEMLAPAPRPAATVSPRSASR
jgi:aminobenzoyl-glutamate utilization protein B